MSQRSRLTQRSQGQGSWNLMRKQARYTITIDGEQQAKMRKAASRQAQIDAGMYTKSGAGTHGGGQRSENRRERHKARQAVRSGQYD